MHLVRQLPGYAFDGFALLAMIFLTAFWVGYSRLVTTLVNFGEPGAPLRFAGLNFLFGIAATVISALVLLGLARRVAWRDDALPPPRLGAFIGIVVVLFLLSMLIQAIWPLIMASSYDGGDKWIVVAARLPASVLQVVLFPVLVWQVGLARGISEPSLGEAWSQVWSNPVLLLTVAVLAAASLAGEQVGQWVFAAHIVSQDVGQIALAGPAAIARVLEILLAIIVVRDMIKDRSPAAVF